MKRIKDPVQAFWARVRRGDGCWEWTGHRNPHGYGQFRRCSLAHRVSYAMAYGAIPDGVRVLHRCDNPSCVRPDHLFLGTQADNVRDMDRKGRGRRAVLPGERNPNAILTAAQATEIFVRRKRGEQGKALAEEFGVSKSTITAVVTGQTWAGQIDRDWLETKLRACEPVRVEATIEQALFPTHAMQIARRWARELRKRSAQS